MDRSRVGPFAIEQPLRADGKGSVHLAIHVKKRRSVALRVFSAPLVKSQSDIRNEYRAEFHKLKKLRHPNIVRCYGGSFDGMDGYIASELIRGESLDELLQRRGRVAWETVIEYTIQVSEALHYAHEAEVVHGDLSLEKILIDQLGTVKVADFRLARQHSGNYTAPRFRRLADVGLVAPELFEPENQATVKSDLYSLGALIHLLLTGEPTHAAADVNELIQRRTSEPAERLSTKIMDCPIWLDVLVSQLLASDPADRPYSAATVTMALQETKRKVAEGTSVAEHSAGGLSPLRLRTDKDEARRLLGKHYQDEQDERPERPPITERPWFLALCLFVLVGGGLAWLLWPVSERRLFEKAQVLMETEDLSKWKDARRRYINRLLQKFPDGQYADQAREYLDRIETAVVDQRIKLRANILRPRSGAEKLYLEALSYERFGDRRSALQKYQSLVDLLASDSTARPYVNLAKRQIESLSDLSVDEVKTPNLVESRLGDAEELAADGKRKEAEQIWKSIVELYGNDADFKQAVEVAKQKLAKGK